MNKLLALLFVFVMSMPALSDGKQGEIFFKSTEYNFGTFPKRTVRRCVFPFVNTGKSPVVIESGSASCACTAVTFSKRPIMPGKKGFVTVYYNGNLTSSNGKFRKTIDLRTNSRTSIVRLSISGETK